MRLLISDANQFKVKQDLLWVGILTFVTALIWITYSIYLAYIQDTVDPEVSAMLEPLNPTLDQEMLTFVADRFEPPQNFVVVIDQEELDDTDQNESQTQSQSPNSATNSATLQINSLNETQEIFPISTSSANPLINF